MMKNILLSFESFTFESFTFHCGFKLTEQTVETFKALKQLEQTNTEWRKKQSNLICLHWEYLGQTPHTHTRGHESPSQKKQNKKALKTMTTLLYF